MTQPLSTARRERPALVLVPRRGWRGLGLHELYPWRGLLWALVWRDIRSRYRQAALGVLWAIIRPVATTAVFTVVLGRLAKVDADGRPYGLFAFTGMLAWSFFASATQTAALSVVGAGGLVTKVYFPRVLIPLASVGSATLDFMVGMLVLAGLLLYHDATISAAVLFAPLAMLWVAVVTCGVGVLLSAVVVLYRDVGHAMAFLIQVWMYITPVLYPLSMFPPHWRPAAYINPMTGPVEAFRWAVLGTPIDASGCMLSAATGVLALIVGLLAFQRVERRFADLI